MSIHKTLCAFISLFLFSSLLAACGTRQNTSVSLPPERAEVSTRAESTERLSAGEQLPDFIAGLGEEEDHTLPEPDETVAREVRELESLGSWAEGPNVEFSDFDARFDFPITINKQVQFYLDFFQNEQRRSFSRWLARSGRYLVMIEEALQEAGLPLDLVYLPMIESGYSLTAVSRAKAVGPWQFIAATGRRYGLRIDDYVDERRDPIKSTRAAVNYLTQLFAEFGDWQLAVAGYNAGEGRIRWALRQTEADDFWQLSDILPTETKLYVPKLIAAIIIAREPEKYGFTDINYEEPLAFETVAVPRLTSLKAVAIAGDIDFEKLQDLNRELRKAVIPPQQASYLLRVPAEKADLVASNLPRVRSSVTTTYKIHIVRKQETITQICRRYSVNKATLLKANNLASANLKAGQRLRIPQQNTTYKLLSENQVRGSKPAAVAAENLMLHTVRPGETISGIARTYNVPAHLIVSWNDLGNMNRIKAGQQLALYLVQVDSAASREKISSKDLKIAGVNTEPAAESFSSANNQSSSSFVYQVKDGDTLWEISRRFKVSTEQIKRWNYLRSNLIQPGLELVLRLDEDQDV
jgi:membrane-bound lytic murein transglycosylase D